MENNIKGRPEDCVYTVSKDKVKQRCFYGMVFAKFVAEIK